MSEVTIEPGPDDTPTIVPTGDQAATAVSTDGQVVIGGLDATGVDEGFVPTADGADGWAWAEQQGSGAQDTGPRNIEGLVTNGSTFYLDWGHLLQIRRSGSIVTLAGTLWGRAGTGPSLDPWITVPVGFRPDVWQLDMPVNNDGGLGLVTHGLITASDGRLRIWRKTGTGAETFPDGCGYYFNIAYTTDDAWPTTLPGTPA